MIQVVAIHPSILSASQYDGGIEKCKEAQDNLIRYDDARKEIEVITDRIKHTKERIQKNSVLREQGINIRTPNSFNLEHELSQVPPWSEKTPYPLTLLKGKISKFFANHQIILDDQQQEYICKITNLASAFPYNTRQNFPAFFNAWCETVTMARCKQKWTALNVCNEAIFAIWCNHKNECAGRAITFGTTHKTTQETDSLEIPIDAIRDDWEWERTIRQYLWQDDRLPFWGSPFDAEEGEDDFEPRFGFQPTDQWEIGSRPASRRGYVDRLGGRWQWGQRAETERHPFGGHWDVQLDDRNAKTSWNALLEQAYGCTVRLNDTHINIEPDGSITDKTFELT